MRIVSLALALSALLTVEALLVPQARAEAPATVRVGDPRDLFKVLSSVKGGETVLLAPGHYGSPMIHAPKHPWSRFAAEVTLRSEDPQNPAVFGGLRLNKVENLTFEDVTFDYEASPGAAHWVRLIELKAGANIAFVGVTFDGDLAEGLGEGLDGYGTGYAIVANGLAGLRIEGSEFFDFHRAAVIGGSQDVVVRGNKLHSMRSDGINLGQVQRALVEGNHIHDFRTAPGSSDHPDMIQVWTNGSSKPSEDITIRSNILDVGGGAETQSIFMRNDMVDRGKAGRELFYRRITIENNLIRNGHLHGITLGEGIGTVVRNNTILYNAASAQGSHAVPRIAVSRASENVTIENNVVAGIGRDVVNDPPPGWRVRNNLFVQRQSGYKPNFYAGLFVDALADHPSELATLYALPGSVIEREGLGSSLARFGLAPLNLHALARTTPDPEQRNGFIFDARLSRDARGFLPESAARFEWDFGDGTTGTGLIARHRYTEPGDYTVTLRVIRQDGREDSATSRAVVPDPRLIHLVATPKGIVERSPRAAPVGYDQARYQSVTGPDGSTGFALTSDQSVKISRSHAPHINGLSAFSISLALKPGGRGGRQQSAGEILRLHGSFRAILNADGSLFFDVWTDGGGYHKIQSPRMTISRARWHDVTLTFDGRAGEMAIHVDGRRVAVGAAAGNTPTRAAHDLMIGASWKPGINGALADILIENRALGVSEIARRHTAL
ncbi:MAG: right-handed parallel beta-helix repeat-containing protein [Pseudomonadota bacterium]